jgi:hypothetical protein
MGLQWHLPMLKLGTHLPLERCPHCGVDRPTLAQVSRFETNEHRGGNPRTWAAYGCARCGGVTLGWQHQHDSNAQVRELFPPPQEVDDAIPERGREYLSQALNSVNAPAGAVMLTASAVDAMLKAKGYADGSLYSRIDQAAADHVITPDMASWAHVVRLDASDQSHADAAASLPTAEDARHAIAFAMALGQFMFVLPSRVRRGIREAKRG